MRHHFGDLLGREGGYWTIIPNRDRYAYRIGDVPAGSQEVTIITIGKDDETWPRVLTLPNLEELTLHDPTKEQLAAIGALQTVKRLRITHARPHTVDFISSMEAVEELVLEYVSGFHDLTPLRALSRLRALHCENLRRVTDFSGLAGSQSLKYLSIYGTTDWKQPINDFAFLSGLPGLEVFALWQAITKAPYPALLPALSLKNLKQVRIHRSFLATEEYALLEEGLEGVAGADWGSYQTTAFSQVELTDDDVRAHLPEQVIRSNHPDVMLRYDGKRMVADPNDRWYDFTGKGTRRIKVDSPNADARCQEHAERYASMRAHARAIIDGQKIGV